METRTLYMLAKCSTTELHHQSYFTFYFWDRGSLIFIIWLLIHSVSQAGLKHEILLLQYPEYSSSSVPAASAQAHVFKLSLYSSMFFICTSALLPSWTLHVSTEDFCSKGYWVYIDAPCACRCLERPGGNGSPGTGVADICEPPDVCEENRTQVFCKRSMCV